MKKSFLHSFCKFIVDKRFVFYGLFLALTVFSAIMLPKTVVDNDISAFLPWSSETKQALDIMETEFGTFSTVDIMLKDGGENRAQAVKEKLTQIDGISSVGIELKDDSSLITVMLLPKEDYAPVLQEIRLAMEDQMYYSVALSRNMSSLGREMRIILIIAVVVIIVVLLFTSKSFLEIPVFLIVFGVAGILNMGTNFIFSSVSFVTNSIAVVLQLALAVDYAIILGHRYVDERKTKPPKEAMIQALQTAIKEILSSSLTTIAGLVALMLMTLQIGQDLGLVLGKGIIMSCLTVFFLMPGLLLLFAKPIDKTMHRSFVPSVTGVAKKILKARYVLASLFLCFIVAGGVLQSFNTYSYDYSDPQQVVARKEIESVFGKSETVGFLMKDADYEQQYEAIVKLQSRAGVKKVTGLAAIELNGMRVTQKLTAKQLSDAFPQIPYLVSFSLYSSYAKEHGITDSSEGLALPLVDIAEYAANQPMISGLLPAEVSALLKGKKMLDSGGYARVLVTIDATGNLEQDFLFLDALDSDAKSVVKSSLMFGNYAVTKDLSRGFSNDLLLVSIMTVVFILLILLFTFKSIGLPLILIVAIQGSIFINFSIPVILGYPVFFMSYIIVSAIQMGATIDYAIVITNRYLSRRQQNMPPKEAMAQALNASFPSVITSGLMLTVAGILVGTISTQAIISSIGLFLGVGACISLIVVLFALPQLLVVLDKFIQKTTLKKKPIALEENLSEEGYEKEKDSAQEYTQSGDGNCSLEQPANLDADCGQ